MPWFSLGLLFLAVSCLPTALQAAEISIKNCGSKPLPILAYNKADTARIIGSDGATLFPGQTRSFRCQGSHCHIKVDGHLFTNTSGGSFYVFWPEKASRPEIRQGFQCVVASKSTVVIRNCRQNALLISVYNEKDGLRVLPITKETLSHAAVHTFFCEGNACQVRLGSELLPGSYKGPHLAKESSDSSFEFSQGTICPPLATTVFRVKNCLSQKAGVLLQNSDRKTGMIGLLASRSTETLRCRTKTCILRFNGPPAVVSPELPAGDYSLVSLRFKDQTKFIFRKGFCN